MAYATAGYGVGGSIGLATESTYGTPATPTSFIPFVSESLKTNVPLTKAASIIGDRSVTQLMAGVRACGGDIEVEVDGAASFGQLYQYFNGNASGAHTVASMGAGATGLSGTPTTGTGTLPAGTYYCKVQTVLAPTNGGNNQMLPAGNEATVTLSATGEITLTWTNPGSLPAGFTQFGTAIFIGTTTGGETAFSVVTGTATTATVSAPLASSTLVPLGASAVPFAPTGGTIYVHTFSRAFVPGYNPLPGFTVTVGKNNDYADQLIGCRMGGFALDVGSGNEAVKCKFSLMARDFGTCANPTPTVTDVAKFMSWQTQVCINGTFSPLYEKFSLSGKNGIMAVPGRSNIPRLRDIGYGEREFEGKLTRQFNDHSLWNLMNSGTPFSLQINGWGAPMAPSTAQCSFLDASGNLYTAFQYQIQFSATECLLENAGGNIGGPSRIMEDPTVKIKRDPGTGNDVVVTLYNLTSSYS